MPRKFLVRNLKSFSTNSCGSVAIIAAIALSGMMIAAGIAVDYGNSITVRSKMQSAADAAALAAAATQLTTGERKKLAQDVFAKNIDADQFISAPTVGVVIDKNKEVVVSASGKVRTNFMSIAGFSDILVAVNAAAGLNSMNAEIALVLDVSGSMRAGMGGQTRIDVLKQAAHDLIDTVSSNNGGSKPVKFGIVPFTANVNVGPDQNQFITGSNHALFAGTTWAGCVFEHPPLQTVFPGFTGIDVKANNKWHAYIWPPTPDGVPSSGAGRCINPSDGTNDGYEAVTTNAAGDYNPWSSGPNYNCVRHPILPLTSTVSDVHDKIDELTAESNMGTIIAPGISWGKRILEPSAPFSEATNFSSDMRKILIVLTDGEQTTEAEFQPDSCHTATNTTTSFSFNPGDFNLSGNTLSNVGPDDLLTPYGFILDSDPFGTSPSDMNDVKDDLQTVSLAACTEANAPQAGGREIEVYSIAVSSSAGPGTSVYSLLRDCASKPENFYYADDGAALAKAFEDITESVLNVRLTH